MTFTLKVLGYENQVLSRKIQSEIRDEFNGEMENWKDQGQKNLSGKYELQICEKIEYTGDMSDMIAIPIEKVDEENSVERDGGFLHIYGIREMEK